MVGTKRAYQRGGETEKNAIAYSFHHTRPVNRRGHGSLMKMPERLLHDYVAGGSERTEDRVALRAQNKAG